MREKALLTLYPSLSSRHGYFFAVSLLLHPFHGYSSSSPTIFSVQGQCKSSTGEPISISVHKPLPPQSEAEAATSRSEFGGVCCPRTFWKRPECSVSAGQLGSSARLPEEGQEEGERACGRPGGQLRVWNEGSEIEIRSRCEGGL